MDEYIESVATTARVPRFKIWLKTDVYEICVFMLRCENYGDFRDYYFNHECVDTPDTFQILHLCFHKFPNLFAALMKFECMSIINIDVSLLSSQYMFKVLVAGKTMYKNTGFLGNVIERLAVLGFVPVYYTVPPLTGKTFRRRILNYTYSRKL